MHQFRIEVSSSGKTKVLDTFSGHVREFATVADAWAWIINIKKQLETSDGD